MHGVQLPQPPSDGVTALRFASHSALLLLSSWDGVSKICCRLLSLTSITCSEPAKPVPAFDPCWRGWRTGIGMYWCQTA